MHTAIRLDDVGHLTHLEGVCCVFERLLHHPAAEVPQVTPIGVRGAIRMLRREFTKLLGISIDFGYVLAQDLSRLLLRACDRWLEVEDKTHQN